MPKKSDSQQKESADAQPKSQWPLHAQTWLEEFVKEHGPIVSAKLVHKTPVQNWRIEEAEAEAEQERIRKEVLAMPKMTMEELKALRAAVLQRRALALLNSQDNSKTTPESNSSESSPSEPPAAA